MTISTRYHGPQSSPLENHMIGEFVSTGIWGKPDIIRDYCSMAVIDDTTGKVIAGTLFHNWHPEEGIIELSSFSLSKRWLTRRVIRDMFSLPFDRFGCQLVVLRVSERNLVMIDIARSFGFTEVYIPRLRGRDEGEFIFSFNDDQWAVSKYNTDKGA